MTISSFLLNHSLECGSSWGNGEGLSIDCPLCYHCQNAKHSLLISREEVINAFSWFSHGVANSMWDMPCFPYRVIPALATCWHLCLELHLLLWLKFCFKILQSLRYEKRICLGMYVSFLCTYFICSLSCIYKKKAALSCVDGIYG